MYTKYFKKYSGYQRDFNFENEYFVSIIKVRSNNFRKVMPIKTNVKVSLNKLLECSKAVRRIFISDNVKFGDIICKNVINSGADIVSIKAHKANTK